METTITMILTGVVVFLQAMCLIVLADIRDRK